MDAFKNAIQAEKFRYTNRLWNTLKLNHPQSIGYVSTLIESHHFNSKEEWRDFYFASGEERIAEAKRLGLDLRTISSYHSLNTQYGRTEKELADKGKILYEAIVDEGNPLNITLAECVYAVKFRVIAETWNGIILREKNTVEQLTSLFPQCTFLKVPGETDFLYAIDYEVYCMGKLCCALQIKPPSYAKGNNSAIATARQANEQKNARYEEEFHCPVLYAYSNTSGELTENNVIQQIQQCIQQVA